MVAPGDAFQSYFWGEKNAGYDVLLTNFRQGVSATKEFHDILKERANYEEGFSKSLKRLSDKASTIDAVGTFLPVWSVIKKYLENVSKIHGDFSAKFKELCQELGTVKNEKSSQTSKQLKERMELIKTASSLSNIKQSLDHMTKCKKLYHQKHKDLIDSEESLTNANTNNTNDPKSEKEFEKIQQKYQKSQEAFQLAESTYKTSVQRYNDAQEEYNKDMTSSCKFFGEIEQAHLNNVVDFARRFGNIETDLIEELKKNCESILGGDTDENILGLVGYSTEHLIEIFVDEKKTGVEMCEVVEAEILTVKDPPIPICVTPKPILEKSSDSGSVNSLPSAHNITSTTTASVNMNSMTLAVSNAMSMKAIKKMIKRPKKGKNKNEPDSKSIDSKQEDNHENGTDDISEKSASEQDSGGQRSEQDFYERHATAYFSSDDDDMVGGDDDSEEDGLTAKVKTLKIKTDPSCSTEQVTEEDLRKAAEKITLTCLSPNTHHRDRSKTHNPLMYSAYSHSLVDLPISPESTSKLPAFPTSFNTPRTKSLSGNNLSGSPSLEPRTFQNNNEAPTSNHDAWAVFDDSFKSTPVKRASDGNVMDSAASLQVWSTPPVTRRDLFGDHKIKDEEAGSGIESLLEFAPASLVTPAKTDNTKNLDELLSITLDDQRAMSPSSDYMVRAETPDGSPTENKTESVPEEVEEEKKESEDKEESEDAGARRKRLPSLIEFSPVKPLNQEAGGADPLSSTQRSEDGLDARGEEEEGINDEVDSGVAMTEQSIPPSLALSNDIYVEDSKLLSPLSTGSKNSLDSSDNFTSSEKSNGVFIRPSLESSPDPAFTPDILILTPASTENVEFSPQSEETAETDHDRDMMVYPIAIAIIETTSAVFKANNECLSKIDGELIMSLPCDAAADLATLTVAPPLRIRLTSTTLPHSFIVNRQIFSIKPPTISDVMEINMNLLQDLLKKRLETIGTQQRINIPLLKYKTPNLKGELAPLVAQSFWTTSGDQTVLSIDASVNKTLADRHFYFPRITFSNTLSQEADVLSSEPPAEVDSKTLKWVRVDLGNEIVENPDRLQVTFKADPGLRPTKTDIEFEIEGVVISGTDVLLENSESYSIFTTVKKMRSDKYWTEPKVIDSNC